MEFFVSKEGFHRRKYPHNPTYIIQSNRQNGLKPIKRTLYSECRIPKANKVLRFSDHTLPSSRMQCPRFVKIEPGNPRGIREMKHLGDSQPTDLRYCPNININTSACGPTTCTRARYPSFDDGNRANSAYRPCRILEGDRANADQYILRSDIVNAPHRDYCSICDQVDCQIHSTPGRLSQQIRLGQDKFDQAHVLLYATVLKATKFLNIFYSRYIDEIRNRRHLSKEERTDLWRQMVAEIDDIDHLRSVRYHEQGYHTSAQARDRMHRRDRLSNMDTSFRDIKRELHDQFINFECCLETNMTRGYDEEARLQQCRDKRRIHGRIVHDIDEVRPLLDRMRHDDDVARMVLCELDIILSRLDGYRKYWADNVRYEQRRRHDYNFSRLDDEGRINQSIWL